MSQDEITALEQAVATEPHLREAQKRLAAEMTAMIHGEEEVDKAIFAAAALFGKGEIRDIDAATMESLNQATGAHSYESLEDVQGILSVLVDAELCKSSGEARKLVQGNGISLNNEKVKDFRYVPLESDLIHGSYIVVRKGKKEFAVVKFAKS